MSPERVSVEWGVETDEEDKEGGEINVGIAAGACWTDRVGKMHPLSIDGGGDMPEGRGGGGATAMNFSSN